MHVFPRSTLVRIGVLGCLFGIFIFGTAWAFQDETPKPAAETPSDYRPVSSADADSVEAEKAPLPTAGEALARAKLVHETIHATLHFVHQEYFRDDEGKAIPAATMKKVFRELKESEGIEARWMAVNAIPMSVDHKVRDDFEKEAANVLNTGKYYYDKVEGDRLRYVGSITLAADCLSCHVPSRRSNHARIAGLSISIPIAGPSSPTP